MRLQKFPIRVIKGENGNTLVYNYCSECTTEVTDVSTTHCSKCGAPVTENVSDGYITSEEKRRGIAFSIVNK